MMNETDRVTFPRSIGPGGSLSSLVRSGFGSLPIPGLRGGRLGCPSENAGLALNPHSSSDLTEVAAPWLGHQDRGAVTYSGISTPP